MTIVNSGDQTFSKDIQEGWVLVDFWAPWCGPCKMIAPVLEELNSEWQGETKIVKVDVDVENQTASQQGIMSIPSLVLFKDGVKVAEKLGYQPKEVIEEWVMKHRS